MSGPLRRSPGPWVVTHRHVHGTVHDDEIHGLGLEIEAIERPLIRGDYALAGDAHLIAAAPELLEALKGLLEAVDRLPSYPSFGLSPTSVDARAVTARAVIARAEGREP